MAAPSSRDTLIEYCLRRLGDPVIEINVDPDQLEDRVDEALQYYQEFHSDATVKTYLKHQVTADDVSNEYISISSNVIFVQKLFPISSSFNNSMNFFDIKYQMMLNDIADLQNFAGDLAYYDQMQQYLSLLDLKLNGHPQVNFSRRQNRLYIHGDFQDNDIKEDDYVVAEVLQIVDPSTHTTVFDDMWLKSYTTALIKRQWGANLIKFEGMQLPGGVTLNGRQIYDDAQADIEKLEEKVRMEQELPVDFFVG
jgi:hypothetical protein|tara:strand:- start:3220 stop:3975 length:756 start_codon:yes stop_codon:yes gene_type:complete